MCKRMEQLSKLLGPAVHCGKDTTHKTLETMGIARAWPQQCSGRTVQTDPTFSRYASAITEQRNVASCWPTGLRIFSRGLKVALHLKRQQAFYGIQKK